MKTIIIKAGQGEGKSSLALELANRYSEKMFTSRSIARYELDSLVIKQGTKTANNLAQIFSKLGIKNDTDVIIFDEFTSLREVEIIEKTIRCGFSVRHKYDRSPERINSEMTLIFCVQDV